MFRKGDFVEYDCGGRVITAIVRRAHRDGTVTVEARHELDAERRPCGCYLGYRYRYDVHVLRKAEAA